MLRRSVDSLTEQVSDLQTNLEELKELQYFGGDALVVNEYEAELSDDFSADYTLTLTPDDPGLGVLPSTVELKWTNSNMNSQAMVGYYVYQVYRSDGVFEWRISGGHSDYFITYLLIQWIGKGTVELVRNS